MKTKESTSDERLLYVILFMVIFVAVPALHAAAPSADDLRKAALHVRRGIAEYIPVPADYLKKSDYVIKMDSETWAGLYLNAISLSDSIDSGNVSLSGDKKDMAGIFDMFDKFKPSKNYMIPPLED